MLNWDIYQPLETGQLTSDVLVAKFNISTLSVQILPLGIGKGASATFFATVKAKDFWRKQLWLDDGL